jgi:uncharacterized protein YkwD
MTRLAGYPLLLIIAAALVTPLAGAAAPEQAHARCKYANTKTTKLTKKQARKAVRCVVNRERSARNLKPRPALRRAAQKHTRYMRKHNCFSHQCPGEPPLETRVRSAGYLRGARAYSLGEVVAYNRARATPRDIVRQLMGSPGHRQQLMDPGYRHLGVGVSARNGTSLYTIVLGSKR